MESLDPPAAERRIGLPRHLLLTCVAVAVVTPFVARLPAVPWRGWEWLAAYLSGNVLVLCAFNLVPAAALYAVGRASKRAPVAFILALMGLVWFLLWAHGTLNLGSSSTAAIALVFIPVYAVGAVIAGGALGWLAHAIVTDERGRIWIARIAAALAIVFGVGFSVEESARVAHREGKFPVVTVSRIALVKRAVYACCGVGRVQATALDNFDAEPGIELLVLGSSGTALLNADDYAVKLQSPFAHQDCEGCVHLYPSLAPDGKGSFVVATSDGVSDSTGRLLWATKARGFSRTAPITSGGQRPAFVADHNRERIDFHDADGRVLWSAKLPVETVGVYVTADGQNLPFAIAGGRDRRQLHVYDVSGTPVRTIPLPEWALNVQSISWPTPGHLLVGAGNWVGVVDPDGKEILRHVIEDTSFNPYHGPDGTAIKLSRSQKPWLAVASHGSSGYARSVLLIFDSEGQLVWQEEMNKFNTMLAVPLPGGEGEVLLLGGMDGVVEYRLTDGPAASPAADAGERKR